MKELTQYAVDAVNYKTWTGLSLVELAKAGRIDSSQFPEIAKELTHDFQVRFRTKEMSVVSLIKLSKSFEKKCVELLTDCN